MFFHNFPLRVSLTFHPLDMSQPSEYLFYFQANNNSESSEYVWRIDLGQTEKYWSGWFKGLSNTFLNCPVPKMLLLAGIDRLDKDLTVGQMQGEL